MDKQESFISNAFQTFYREAPKHSAAWMKMVKELAEANSLDQKTGSLAYLAVLAALGRTSGIPFHVKEARKNGATKEEVISACLVGLPAAGHIVTQALPAAVEAYNLD